MTDKRTDEERMAGQMHTLTMRGNDVASLVEFCPLV